MRNRKERKDIAKRIEHMTDTEVYETIARTCDNYGNALLRDALEVLHKTFGFGVKRQDRFIALLNKEMTKHDNNL
jgi:hypothetical protein